MMEDLNKFWTAIQGMLGQGQDQARSPVQLSALSSTPAPTYGAQGTPETGSGAEALLSGGQLATGSGAEGKTDGTDWQKVLGAFFSGAGQKVQPLQIPPLVPSPPPDYTQTSPITFAKGKR